ncbi:hypothetical protein [Streptomyces sp. NPDC050263]|uniref:hypothetical protein n=1 Tax=Streptomyces sp. NPDC050263 TaxID=3155037 RepID=UPI00343034BC
MTRSPVFENKSCWSTQVEKQHRQKFSEGIMSVSTVPTSNRTKKAVLSGAIAAVILVAAAVAGNYWWTEHNRPSQASKADCALAQQLVDAAKEIPSDKAGVAKWEKTVQKGRAQLKDGYLASSISNFHGMAAAKAKGEGAPTEKMLTETSDKANEHCADAVVVITFPPLSS